MRRALIVVVLLTVLLHGRFPSMARPVSPLIDPTGAAHELTVSGASWRLVDGLFDATGPDVDGVDPRPLSGARPMQEDAATVAASGAFGSHRIVPGGDFSLPTDRTTWPDFTADVAAVSFEVTGNTLAVDIRYTSMPRPDAAVATVTFAAAGDGAGAPRSWPAGAGVRSPWQAAVTVSGAKAFLHGSGGSKPVHASTGDHTNGFEVPLAALPARPWTVIVGAGLTDPIRPGTYWHVPSGPSTPVTPGARGASRGVAVWDLAQEGPTWSAFGDGQQADVLRSGDVSSAAFSVGGTPRGAAGRPGTVTRNFLSRWDGGDGLVRDPSGVAELGPPPVAAPAPDPGPATSWIHTGRLQHYGLHVPSGYDPDGPAPLVVYLHGSGGDVSELFTAYPDLVEHLSSEVGALVLAPLGRGDTFYRSGPGELDVLEAIADVRSHYAVDAERIFLVGFSGGAAGVNVVSSRHPDLFAGTVALGVTWEEGTLVGNIASVPWLGVMGEADPTSHALDGAGLYAALSDRADDATLVRFVAKTHEFSLVYDSADLLLDFVASRRRDPAPPVVRWAVKAGDARPAIGLTRGGAWWLGRVEPADGAAGADVSVRTGGLGRGPAEEATADRSEALVDVGGRSGRTLARISSTRPVGNPQVRVNRLDVEARNVRRAQVDAVGAGLSAAEPLTIRSTADVPLRLDLAGFHGERLVSIDGSAPSPVVSRDRVLAVDVPAGTHTVTVTSADA